MSALRERNKRLRRQSANELLGYVERGARDPFQVALATALAGAPSRRDWKRLAADKPHLWANAVQKLAEPAGYVPRSMSVSVTTDAGGMAAELVRRFGGDSARQMLEAAGLPVALLSHIEPSATESGDGQVIEHAEPANVIEPGDESETSDDSG